MAKVNKSTQYSEAGTFYAYDAKTGELTAWPEIAGEHNLIGGSIVAELPKNLATEAEIKQAFYDSKQVQK